MGKLHVILRKTLGFYENYYTLLLFKTKDIIMSFFSFLTVWNIVNFLDNKDFVCNEG
jgi:hypothetical protein